MNTEKNCAALLLGAPGSGKTTLANALAARHEISVLGAGNLLEDEIRRSTPLGRQIKPYKAAGKLVPAELLHQVLSNRLSAGTGKSVLFDGFPRTLSQIDILFELLKLHHLELCGVIVLNLDQDAAVARISGRRMCQKCKRIYNIYTQPPEEGETCDRCGGKLVQREDDRTEVVRERFKIYERETLPVIEFFRGKFRDLTWEAPASLPPEQLLERVWHRLETAAHATTTGAGK